MNKPVQLGSSTGGTQAIESVLLRLPGDNPDQENASIVKPASSKPVHLRADHARPLGHFAKHPSLDGAQIEGCSGQYDPAATSADAQPRSGSDRLVEIGLESRRRWKMLGKHHVPVLQKLVYDRLNVPIRQVLQHLPDEDDVARRKDIGGDVDQLKIHIECSKLLPVAQDQRLDHIASDIAPAEWSELRPDCEVTASEVDGVGFAAQAPQEFLHGIHIDRHDSGHV